MSARRSSSNPFASESNNELRNRLTELKAREKLLAEFSDRPVDATSEISAALALLDTSTKERLRGIEPRLVYKGWVLAHQTKIDQLGLEIDALKPSQSKLAIDSIFVGFFTTLLPTIVSFLVLRSFFSNHFLQFLEIFLALYITTFCFFAIRNARLEYNNIMSKKRKVCEDLEFVKCTYANRDIYASAIKTVAPFLKAEYLRNEALQELYLVRKEIGDREDLLEKRKSTSRTSLSPEVKKFVFERDNGACVKCKSSKNLHFDHIIPWSKGGADIAENLQILCKNCNLRKGARLH